MNIKELLDQNGLLGVAIIMIIRLGWDMYKDKSKLSEDSVKKNTEAVILLANSLEEVKKLASEIPKLKLDISRSFKAHKHSFKEDYPKVMKQIIEEENLNG